MGRRVLCARDNDRVCGRAAAVLSGSSGDEGRDGSVLVEGEGRAEHTDAEPEWDVCGCTGEWERVDEAVDRGILRRRDNDGMWGESIAVLSGEGSDEGRDGGVCVEGETWSELPTTGGNRDIQ